MTTNVKLLPLPEHMKAWANSLADDAQAYARANMEPLIEQLEFQAAVARELLPYQERAIKAEAENERLRAEAAKRDGIDPWAVLLRAQEAEARAERLAEALSLLPDETDMIEHNPDEGMYMSCCGREVKSRGLYDLLMSHDDDCWYVRMQAMREQEDGK